MASEPVRIALVGAGRMGRVHLGALQGSDGIELVGVVEPVDRTRAELWPIPFLDARIECIAIYMGDGEPQQ